MIAPNHQQAAQAQQKAASPSERKRLLSLAYGYLGSLIEAEDIVQESLLRLVQSDPASIQNVEAWLTTVATRLALSRLRSAQHRREIYPGEWLPEPVFNAPDPEQAAITQSRLSVGLLYLLEKLEPEQRIVFVLREVFDYAYGAIAELTGRSDAACRQLMLRARASLSRGKGAAVSGQIASPVVIRFVEALARGDQDELLSILAKESVLVGDGGGKAPSVLNPVFGADRIARFFLGILRKAESSIRIEHATVNSGPGLLTYQNGQLTGVASVSVEGDRIAAIYAVTNPDKIRGSSSPLTCD